MNLTIEQLFGVGVTQTSDSLIIQKSALLGLDSSSFNTAESLLAAMIFTASQVFQGVVTCPDGSTLTDPQGNAITFDNSNLYELLNMFQWDRAYIDSKIRDTFVIQTFELYAG